MNATLLEIELNSMLSNLDNTVLAVTISWVDIHMAEYLQCVLLPFLLTRL